MKNLFIIFCFGLSLLSSKAQDANNQVSIVLWPSQSFMVQNDFVKDLTVNGVNRKQLDYEKSFNHKEMEVLLMEFSEKLNSLGFYCATYKTMLDKIKMDKMAAENAKLSSGGVANIDERPIHDYARNDFNFFVGYTHKEEAGVQLLTLEISMVEPGTGRIFGSVTNVMEDISGSSLAVLLRTAYTDKLREIGDKANKEASDIRMNGRYIGIEILPTPESGLKMTSMLGGATLSRSIKIAISEELKGRSMGKQSTSDVKDTYEGLRISYLDEFGTKSTAFSFIETLASKLYTKGIIAEPVVGGIDSKAYLIIKEVKQ